MVAASSANPRQSLLAGLIGYGIQGSLTPAMHEQEGAAQGLRYVYRRIDLQTLGLGAEALPELLTAAERMGFNGLNITFPCKQAVMPLLHELSEDAAASARSTPWCCATAGGSATTPTLRASPRVSGAACPTWRSTESCRSAPVAPARRWRRRPSSSASGTSP